MTVVTVGSDPMVDVLTALTDSENAQYVLNGGSKVGQYIPIPGMCERVTYSVFIILNAVFYVSFVVTPVCSNASEIISSLIFASKKKKINSSMTYAQVRGMCVGGVHSLLLPTAIRCSHNEQHPGSGSLRCSYLLQRPGLAVFCW